MLRALISGCERIPIDMAREKSIHWETGMPLESGWIIVGVRHLAMPAPVLHTWCPSSRRKIWGNFAEQGSSAEVGVRILEIGCINICVGVLLPEGFRTGMSWAHFL